MIRKMSSGLYEILMSYLFYLFLFLFILIILILNYFLKIYYSKNVSLCYCCGCNNRQFINGVGDNNITKILNKRKRKQFMRPTGSSPNEKLWVNL